MEVGGAGRGGSPVPGTPTDPDHVTSKGVLPPVEKGTSLGADAWRRLRRNKLALIGMAMLAVIALLCFVGPLVWGTETRTAEANHPELSNQPPTWEEPFGRDGLGRSYFIRVLEGGRISLAVGIVATVVSIVIGTFYGAVAGYYGGKLDEIMMRVVDFLYGIPYMFLVILIMLMFSDEDRENPIPVFMALGLVQWLTMARLVRGGVIALRHQEFVQAARVLGASDGRIISRHIIPNVLGVVVIYATLTVPAVILLESFLSFLGLGVKLSWGVLVSEAVVVLNPLESYWWLLLWPGVFLAMTLFGLNFLGDGLRDALDPRTRQ